MILGDQRGYDALSQGAPAWVGDPRQLVSLRTSSSSRERSRASSSLEAATREQDADLSTLASPFLELLPAPARTIAAPEPAVAGTSLRRRAALSRRDQDHRHAE